MPSWRLLLPATICAALGALIAIALWPDSTPPDRPNGRVVVTGTAKIGGPFRLRNHTGRTVTDRDFRGRYTLVFFGYTHSETTTPAALQLVTAILERLGDTAQMFTPVFVTIDPARDTPARLARFRKRFHPRLHTLTGTEAAITAIAKAYAVAYAPRTAPNGDGPAFDVTPYIYVMKPDGTFAFHFSNVTPLEDAVTRLRALLD